MGDFNELIVTQSNSLVEAAHTLTLNEKRLLALAISQLDSRKPHKAKGEVTIFADEFAGVFGVELKHTYGVIKEGAKDLYDRSIRKFVHEGKITKHQRWLESVEYNAGMGSVTMQFTQGVMPLLTLLHREFTSYRIKQIGGLSTFYAIRFYELMCQFRKTRERTISVENLRDVLDLQDKYPKMADLRRYIIDPSVNDINENTDLTITYTTKTKGRTITALVFDIEVTAGAEQLEMAA